MLTRLLFASRSTRPVTAQLVGDILGKCQHNNALHGVTGILCYSDKVFMQVMEGTRDAVCDTYNRIVGDPRHVDVRLLAFDEISERRFGTWTMGQVNAGKVNPALLLKYAGRAALDPFALSGRTSLSLMEELAATASVLGRSSPVPHA